MLEGGDVADFSGRDTTLNPVFLSTRSLTGMGRSVCFIRLESRGDASPFSCVGLIGSGDFVRGGGVTVSVDAGESGFAEFTNDGLGIAIFDKFASLLELLMER